MIYTQLTKKAINLAYEKHKNQFDKSGLPYILHPIHLAEQMDDENSTITALLHDIVEDTDITFDYLIKDGYPNEVIEAIKLLTHNENEDYNNYIVNISMNPLATKVKIADLMHNSDLSRLNAVTQDDLSRYEKYKKCLDYLHMVQAEKYVENVKHL